MYIISDLMRPFKLSLRGLGSFYPPLLWSCETVMYIQAGRSLRYKRCFKDASCHSKQKIDSPVIMFVVAVAVFVTPKLGIYQRIDFILLSLIS